MKILKQGTPPEKRVFTATCNYCKTEIEFEQGEAKRVNDQRDGDFLSIPCPTCGHQITKAL